MKDKIRIHDLHVGCIIGVRPEERIQKQQVLINIELECDLSAAAKSDSIEDTVDYSAIKSEVVDAVEKSTFYLIEKMAAMIANLCLNREGVTAVRVGVEKPGALTFARSVSVEIYRSAAK